MRADAREHRRRMISSYLDLAEEGGIVTMERVAEAADVTRMTLYRHFGDRDTLRRAAVAQLIDDTGRVLRELPDEDPIEEVLEAVIDGGFAVARRVRALSTGLDYGEPALKRRWRRAVAPLVRRLRAAQERGELRRDAPPGYLADALVSLLEAALDHGAGLDARTRTRWVLTLFLRGAERGNEPD
jgi:AcrR family transcriptional regulator